jgi:AcrR family transcriptional regulator
VAATSYNSPRRREAAALTRQAILDAARRLFVDHGYVATTIHDIASAARVATGTVYTSVGGKPQLLHELIASTTEDARRRGPADVVATSADPGEVLEGCVAGIRLAVQEYGDIAELVLRTAHVDANAAEAAALAEEGFRRELGAIATRLEAVGALNGSVERAVDVLAYYLGYSSWRRLVLDFGWSHDEAQAWLGRQIADALIVSGAPAASGVPAAPAGPGDARN